MRRPGMPPMRSGLELHAIPGGRYLQRLVAPRELLETPRLLEQTGERGIVVGGLVMEEHEVPGARQASAASVRAGLPSVRPAGLWSANKPRVISQNRAERRKAN